MKKLYIFAAILLIAPSLVFGMQVKTGTYTGNATDNRSITGVGFQPDVVIIKGNTTGDTALRISTQSGDVSFIPPLAATSSNMIQAIESDGFQIGTNASVNTSGTAYYYLALKDNGLGDLHVATYTGNGVDNRSITGLGFDPNFVGVFPDKTVDVPFFRISENTAGFSSAYVSFGELGNVIQNFVSDGFQVGTDASANGNGFTYHYVAIKNVSSTFQTGIFTGDGLDNKSITGVGFQPDYVTVKAKNDSFAVHRFKDNVGDSSLTWDSIEEQNLIQQFLSDGFEVGTSTSVNQNTTSSFWFAAQDTSDPVSSPTSTVTIHGSGSVTVQGSGSVTIKQP